MIVTKAVVNIHAQACVLMFSFHLSKNTYSATAGPYDMYMVNSIRNCQTFQNGLFHFALTSTTYIVPIALHPDTLVLSVFCLCPSSRREVTSHCVFFIPLITNICPTCLLNIYILNKVFKYFFHFIYWVICLFTMEFEKFLYIFINSPLLDMCCSNIFS